MSSLRVGIGVDAHAFEDGVPLVLGGVGFESPRGLAGHSDGDVITHALIDAVLGAAGLGDIGSLFPSDSSTPVGISSVEQLRDAVALVRAAGYAGVNADCVLLDSDELVAEFHSVPTAWDGTDADLPSGWDEAFLRAFESGRKPDVLSALAISVRPDRQSQGLAKRMRSSGTWNGAGRRARIS